MLVLLVSARADDVSDGPRGEVIPFWDMVLEKFGRNVKSVWLDSTPVSGHAKGVPQLEPNVQPVGDDEKSGWAGIEEAARIAGSVVGGAVTGATGFAAGRAAVDGLISLFGKADARPYGTVDYAPTAEHRNAAERVGAMAEPAAKREDQQNTATTVAVARPPYEILPVAVPWITHPTIALPVHRSELGLSPLHVLHPHFIKLIYTSF